MVAVTLQSADLGDTTTIQPTLREAKINAALVNERSVEEVVAEGSKRRPPAALGFEAARQCCDALGWRNGKYSAIRDRVPIALPKRPFIVDSSPAASSFG